MGSASIVGAALGRAAFSFPFSLSSFPSTPLGPSSFPLLLSAFAAIPIFIDLVLFRDAQPMVQIITFPAIPVSVNLHCLASTLPVRVDLDAAIVSVGNPSPIGT